MIVFLQHISSQEDGFNQRLPYQNCISMPNETDTSNLKTECWVGVNLENGPGLGRTQFIIVFCCVDSYSFNPVLNAVSIRVKSFSKGFFMTGKACYYVDAIYTDQNSTLHEVIPTSSVKPRGPYILTFLRLCS